MASTIDNKEKVIHARVDDKTYARMVAMAAREKRTLSSMASIVLQKAGAAHAGLGQ